MRKVECCHKNSWVGDFEKPKAEHLEPYIKNNDNECEDFEEGEPTTGKEYRDSRGGY